MRNLCDMKELRRLRLFDKAIAAASRCPYLAAVTSWIVAGVGNGARVAATCGSKHVPGVAGTVLLNYPVLDPSPPIGKGGGHADSTRPVLKTSSPLLFVHGAHARNSTVEDVKVLCRRYAGGEGPANTPPPLLVSVPGVDDAFASTSVDAAEVTATAVMQVCHRGRVRSSLPLESVTV